VSTSSFFNVTVIHTYFLQLYTFVCTVPPPDESDLVWSDEFSVDGNPDPEKWDYDVGVGDVGWGNNELQYYTNRLKNAFVSDGALNIRAMKEKYEESEYTSARLVTRNKYDFKYGRVQFRARLRQCMARGSWAALWMLPTEWVYGNWPDSGEIDVMEHVGHDAGRVHGTVHTEAFNHMIGTQVGSSIITSVEDWHTYDIIWDADNIDFIIDGVKYHDFENRNKSSKEWPFDQKFHLIMNIAVGGTWGGQQDIDNDAFEGDGQIMEVDWVRVYNESSTGIPTKSPGSFPTKLPTRSPSDSPNGPLPTSPPNYQTSNPSDRPTIAKCKEKKDCDDGDKCTRDKCKKNGMCVNKKIKKKQCCMTHGDCVNKFANGKCTVFQCKKDKGLCKKKGKRLDCKNAKKCKKGIC